MATKPNMKVSVDFATVAGVACAAASILGGLVLEGGKIRDVAQITAGMIVMGGTLGAVLVTTPLPTFLAALRRLKEVVFNKVVPTTAALEEVIRFSNHTRRAGISALEEIAPQASDPFLAKALLLAADGVAAADIRQTMELELDQEEVRLESESKVFESAGGYAPTIGIIGAVLGLIQVMKHLENIEEVGRGIAVAFVATVYGVAIANLIFLPAAAKLKAHAARSIQIRELMLEGVIGIAEGMNPKLIRTRLEAYLDPSTRPTAGKPRPVQEVANAA